MGFGINFLKREMFLTLNGVFQGVAFENIFPQGQSKELYPTAGLHSMNESLTFNFGLNPFKFDIKSMILKEKKEIIANILNQKIPPIDTHQIVYNYLYMNDYHKTLEVFESSTHLDRNSAYLMREPEIPECKGLTINSNCLYIEFFSYIFIRVEK